jgi:hypothetical protein
MSPATGVSDRYEQRASIALISLIARFKYDGPGPGKGGTGVLSVDGKRESQLIQLSSFDGRKASNSMGKMSTAGVLRLRATSAVSRDQSVRRFAQDDESVGELTERRPL